MEKPVDSTGGNPEYLGGTLFFLAAQVGDPSLLVSNGLSTDFQVCESPALVFRIHQLQNPVGKPDTNEGNLTTGTPQFVVSGFATKERFYLIFLSFLQNKKSIRFNGVYQVWLFQHVRLGFRHSPPGRCCTYCPCPCCPSMVSSLLCDGPWSGS